MNGPGEKTFKQLWRELTKDGWKARKPKGLAKDHNYVKPGVKGRLDPSQHGVDYFVGERELMAFARRSGRLGLPALVLACEGRVPTGKQASYAAIGRQPPSSPPPVRYSPARPPAPVSDLSTPPVVTTTPAAVVAPVDTQVDSEGFVAHAEPATRVHSLVAPSARASCVVPEDTEQGVVALGDIPGDTEQVIRSIQENTEYGPMVVGAIPEGSELRCRVDYSGEDEAKSESDVHETDGTGVDFEVFDSDRFMEGLRAEKLFGKRK